MQFLLNIDTLWLDNRLGGERVASILWCIGIIAATLLLKKPLTRLIAKLTAGIAGRFTNREQSNEFCTMVHKPLEALLQTILFFVAISQLSVLLNHFVVNRAKSKSDALAVRYGDVADHIFLFLFILNLTLVISRTIDFIYQVQLAKAVKESNRERQQLLPLVKEMIKLFLWTMGAFWVLGSVFHVNIPALITGLGIGGVAIALAGKESVENFFAAVTLLVDKPFQAGDTIRMGGLEGAVERIGFRSTWMRNADGSVYIIPNKKLVNENLENLTQRNTRNVKISVTLKYGVAPGQLDAMIKELKQMITDTLNVVQPIDVALEAFGENAFQLALSYHLPPAKDGVNEGAVKQEISMRAYAIINQYTTAASKPSVS